MIQKIVKTTPCPYPGFVVDVVQYEDRNYLELRVYKSNVESFSDPQKVALAEYLYLLEAAINATGTKCIISGVKHDPPSGDALQKGRENEGKSFD